MKHFYMKVVLALVSTFTISYTSYAQPLTGTYTIPGIPYSTLDAAILDLNAKGIGSSVTINLRAGLVNETSAQPNGYVLGSATLSASMLPIYTITINGNGNTLTAHKGAGSRDAIFTLNGVNNVTINELKLTENHAAYASGYNNTNMMERGFNIVKRVDPGDVIMGCQNITIDKCEVTLDWNNSTAADGNAPNGTVAVFIGSNSATSNSMLTNNSAAARHFNINITNDSLRNAFHGIWAVGSKTSVDGVSNDQSITFMSNGIRDFKYHGIYASWANNFYVSKNEIINLDTLNKPAPEWIFGIRRIDDYNFQTNAEWTCVENNIKITAAPETNTSNYLSVGIYSLVYGTATTNISNNFISVISKKGSNFLAGIFCNNNLGSLSIENNELKDFGTSITNVNPTVGIHTGGYIHYTTNPSILTPTSIYTIASDKILVKGNTIHEWNVKSKMANDNTFNIWGIIDNSIENTKVNTIDIENNKIQNINIIDSSNAFVGIGSMHGYGAFTATMPLNTYNVSGNLIDAIYVLNTGNPTPIMGFRFMNCYPFGTVVNSTGNKISNIGAQKGYIIGHTMHCAEQFNSTRDTIFNMRSEASVYGFMSPLINTVNAPVKVNIKQANISTLMNESRGTGGTLNNAAEVLGVYMGNSAISTITEKFTLNKSIINKIYSNNTLGQACGVVIALNKESEISNNIITNIATENSGYVIPSAGVLLNNVGANTLYYNTIMTEVGKTAVERGSIGLVLNPNARNTVMNNIIHNNTLGTGGTLSAAVLSLGGVANTAPPKSAFNAKSNIYYNASGKGENYLYVEGNTPATIINGYHTNGVVENTSRNLVNDTFFNSDCDRSTYHQFMQVADAKRELNTSTENNLTFFDATMRAVPSGISFAESKAEDIPTVGDDFSSSLRELEAGDIGSLQFEGEQLPSMNITDASSSGFYFACTRNVPYFKVSVPSYFNKVSFQWYKNGELIPGATADSVVVDTITAVYTAHVYDSVSGCTYISREIDLTIVPDPQAQIKFYDSLAICSSSAVVLTAIDDPSYVYQWQLNGVNIPGADKDHYVASLAGDYTIEVNSELGCPTVSKPLKLKVYDLPTPNVYFRGDRLLGTDTYYSYQWYRNNEKIDSFANSREYYVLEDGAYTVEVTDSNGCTNKSELYLYSVGIDDPQVLSASIKVFPNPAKDVVNIQSPMVVNVILSDVTGKQIYTTTDKMIQFNTSNLANGTYLLQINDEKGNLINVQKINVAK